MKVRRKIRKYYKTKQFNKLTFCKRNLRTMKTLLSSTSPGKELFKKDERKEKSLLQI